MCDRFTAHLHRVSFIRLTDEDQARRRHRCHRGVAIGVIGNRRTKPLFEKLRGEAAVHDGMERRLATHRLTEDGDPRRIDEVELRKVVERGVGIECLIGQPSVATVGDAADTRAEAVDGKGHVSPGTQPISDHGGMPEHAIAAVQYDNRRVGCAVVGLAELCRQTGIRSRQIAAEVRWRVSREVGELDQGTGRGGADTEQ